MDFRVLFSECMNHEELGHEIVYHSMDAYDSDARSSDSELEGVDYVDDIDETPTCQTPPLSCLLQAKVVHVVEPRITEDTSCPVCFVDIFDDTHGALIYCTAQCGRVFHSLCAGQLEKCPMCRAKTWPCFLFR